MRITHTTKTGSLINVVFCGVGLVFFAGLVFLASQSQTIEDRGFMIFASLLGGLFLIGFISSIYETNHPTELYFELTEEHIEIKDRRKFFGKGFRVLRFKRSEVIKIYYGSSREGSDYVSYLQKSSGRKKRIDDELLGARWAIIKQLLKQEAPEIEVEEAEVEEPIGDKLWKKYIAKK